VFQKPQLFPWRDVAGNAAYGLECRGVPPREARARAEALLGDMGLGSCREARPHELSEGMKQRVNLARALAVDPELLLMDEPYAALDVHTRRALIDELLASLEARPRTVVFASHALEEVVFLADRVAALGGRPARFGDVVEMALARPRGAGTEGRARVAERVVELEALLSAPDR
jgi:NitT/TauT family transport system ATP-binding protein